AKILWPPPFDLPSDGGDRFILRCGSVHLDRAQLSGERILRFQSANRFITAGTPLQVRLQLFALRFAQSAQQVSAHLLLGKAFVSDHHGLAPRLVVADSIRYQWEQRTARDTKIAGKRGRLAILHRQTSRAVGGAPGCGPVGRPPASFAIALRPDRSVGRRLNSAKKPSMSAPETLSGPDPN